MTSQRFLNDKVNTKDFFRSLKAAIPFPAIALAVLCLKYFATTVSFIVEASKSLQYSQLLKEHAIISYFGGATEGELEFDLPIFTMGMVMCGLLLSLSLFSFIFSKKSVNVYFSMGITRKRLFINRIAAGTITLFVASVMPFLLVFIVNAVKFGYHSHQLALFGYYSSLMFVSGMSGFAIGTFAATVSGSRVEMALTSICASGMAPAVAGILQGLKMMVLRGYVNNGVDESSIFICSPWTALTENTVLNNLITGKYIPKYMRIKWNTDIFPIVLWAVATVIIMAVALVLFKKRKNENAHSFGKFYIASAFNGTMVYFASLVVIGAIMYELFLEQRVGLTVCILAAILVTFSAFFVGELIIRRNIKGVVKTLPVYGGLVAASIIAFIVIGTGYFGTYNKLPEIKDIEYVVMNYDDPMEILDYSPNVYDPKVYDREIGDEKSYVSKDAEDIKLCVDMFNKISKDKNRGWKTSGFAQILIKTKDGKFIARDFSIYSEDLAHEYSEKVFNSNYFKNILKYCILDNFQGEYEIDEDGNIIENGHSVVTYFDSAFVGKINYEGSEKNKVLLDDDFREAVCKDLCNITFEEYYGKKTKPIGVLTDSIQVPVNEKNNYSIMYEWAQIDDMNVDPDTSTSYVYSGIMIYPSMTETIKVIEKSGAEPFTPDLKAEKVLVPDKNMTLYSAIGKYMGWLRSDPNILTVKDMCLNDYYYFGKKKANALFSDKNKIPAENFINVFYNVNDIKVNEITDKDKTVKIEKEAYSVYDAYGDNGRVVYIIYSDGSIISKYVPEKSLSVLK